MPDRPEGRIRIHLPRHLLDQMTPGAQGFYPRLIQELSARGARVDLVLRDLEALKSPCPPTDFDFIHQGRIARPRALNTCVAYLDGFWYVDPAGVFAESSLASRPFRPDRLPAGRVTEFFLKLVESRVIGRKSRYDQPRDLRSFGPGHIALFLQTDSDPVQRSKHMDRADMVAAVLAHTGGRTVVIKPHPRDEDPETFRWLEGLRTGRDDVIIADANVHDVLAGAAVSVSISSAAAAEGFLHRVPAVLFGRSDLHPCAVTVAHAHDWPAALDLALATDWPFEAFVFWFFRQGCVPVTWAKFPETVIERMRAQGADLAGLGLAGA